MRVCDDVPAAPVFLNVLSYPLYVKSPVSTGLYHLLLFTVYMPSL